MHPLLVYHPYPSLLVIIAKAPTQYSEAAEEIRRIESNLLFGILGQLLIGHGDFFEELCPDCRLVVNIPLRFV